MSHGGAFRRFNGLRTHRPTNPFDEGDYAGSPCLYTKHHHSHSSRCWRDAKTHACMQCLADIEERKFGLSLDRFEGAVRRDAAKFWSHADITTIDDCWQWNKPLSHGQLYYFWKRPEIRNRWQWHPIAIAVWLSWGDTGRLGTDSVCGNRRCVNPLHNLPKDLIKTIGTDEFDRTWLDQEVELLKVQIAEHQKAEATGSKLKGQPFIPGPVNKDGELINGELSEHNYTKAFESMREMLVDRQHPTQLKP